VYESDASFASPKTMQFAKADPSSNLLAQEQAVREVQRQQSLLAADATKRRWVL
jgi:hypothetical protein